MSRGTGKSRASRERYVMLRHWLFDSLAWKSLPAGPRALYAEMARRYNGSNNGVISYSVREAVGLHISPVTASRWMLILQERGFIVCTRKGHFSHKTVDDASLWLLTEHDSNHPVDHARKTFLRWQPPEDVDLDTLNGMPSHKSKTRLPPRNRTVTPVKPYGYPRETEVPKKGRNGYPRETVKGKKAAPAVTPMQHLYLPGEHSDRIDVRDGDRAGDRDRGVSDAVEKTAKFLAADATPPWEGKPVWNGNRYCLTEHVLSVVNAELDKLSGIGRAQ